MAITVLTQYALDVKTNLPFATSWVDTGDGILRQVTLDSQQLPSGVTPVTGMFVAAGNSIDFGPLPGRGFNVSLWGAFSGAIALTRSFDGGTTHIPTGQSFSAAQSIIVQEPEANVLYRLECLSIGATAANYRLSQ